MVALYSEKVSIWVTTVLASGNLYHLADTRNVRSDSKYVDMDSQFLQFVGVGYGQMLLDIWLAVSDK